jgi:UPF0755 protein
MLKRLLALIAVLVLVGLLWTWRQCRQPYRGFSGNLILVIEPGTRAPEVAQLLVARGVLKQRWPFLLRYWLGRRHHYLKAGEYLFDRPLGPRDVYWKLVQGDVYLHAVVIPEGSDRFDIARILHQQMGISPAEFLRATEQTPALRDLAPQAPTLEGYLFPDTYRFPRNVSASTVVATMLARFRRVYEAKFRRDIQSPLGLHGVMTLASLVEKETAVPAERPLVAGVYLRRLEKRWALQCDPTVIYAIRLKYRLMGRPSAPLTTSDLRLASPYNTYRNPGLPPGPIANPGEASIEGAMHPAPGDALYFVSNNQGGHAFSNNLRDHNRNVAHYRSQRVALQGPLPIVVKPAESTASRHRTKAATSPRHSAKRAKREH